VGRGEVGQKRGPLFFKDRGRWRFGGGAALKRSPKANVAAILLSTGTKGDRGETEKVPPTMNGGVLGQRKWGG